MKTTAVITRFSFTPYMPVIPSLLQIWVHIPSMGSTDWLLADERDSLANLSVKFDINRPAPDRWNIGALVNRKCKVEKMPGGYRFHSFLPEK